MAGIQLNLGLDGATIFANHTQSGVCHLRYELRLNIFPIQQVAGEALWLTGRLLHAHAGILDLSYLCLAVLTSTRIFRVT